MPQNVIAYIILVLVLLRVALSQSSLSHNLSADLGIFFGIYLANYSFTPATSHTKIDIAMVLGKFERSNDNWSDTGNDRGATYEKEDELHSAKDSNSNSVVKYLPESFYVSYVSDRARRQKPSPIRSLFPLENTPNVISLLAGKPNASMFPFTSISFTATSPKISTNDPKTTTQTVETQTYDLSGQLLEEALQYGPTAGMPQLLEWITGLQEYSHGRKRNEGWTISVGMGSQDVIFKAFQILVNPGDAILTETPAYAGVIPIFQALDAQIIDIKTDADGIDTSALRATLENWPADKQLPKVLYTVPYGCNPTGVTATLERRKEVLALSKKYGFLILEDDAYFYLYFGKAPRPPSYFALETEEEEVGRVLRFDSMSKILSSGIRLGFVSGPESLVRAINMYTATSNLQVPGLTQAIAYTLLNSWGYEIFLEHTKKVSEFYRGKRDTFENALRRHLDGLVEWITPEAGMFFWFKLLLKTSEDSTVEEDSQVIIRDKAFERGVLALPGTVFLPGGQKTAYVRASFSLLDEANVNEALRRLREVILEAKRDMNQA